MDFAEIERFLDTPVKRYSSGMYVKLAFAVAAHLSTEILIVDEVLAAAVDAGARLVKPAVDVFWGGYSGYFADPDGFLWEVAWNPGWPLNPDGHVALPE